MPKILVIGDVHAVPNELDDCARLISYVRDICEEYKPDHVVFMGDIYNNHDAMSAKVVTFWSEAFDSISNYNVIVLLGNHDQSNPAEQFPNALVAHSSVKGLTVVDKPFQLQHVGFLPYYYNPEKFLEAAEHLDKNGCKTLFCHQTLDGSKYENGFYAKDSVPIDGVILKFDKVISGHIHTAQKFANVTYVGSPRWRTISDAGVAKSIVLYELSNGTLEQLEAFDTGLVCKKIVLLDDKIENQVNTQNWDTSKDSIRVSVHGTANYVKERCIYLRSLGFLAKGFPDKQQSIKVQESDGIQTAWNNYVKSFKAPFGTPTELLLNDIGEIW